MRPDPKAEGFRWLRQAEHDLSDAEYSLAGSRYNLACFLCQQAAEKALKGSLYARGAEQVLGHSVADLAGECVRLDGEFGALKPQAALPSSGAHAAPGGLAATFGVVALKVRYAPVTVVLWLVLLVRLVRNRRWVWGCAGALLGFLVAVPLLDAWFFGGSVLLLRWGDPAAWVAMARPNPFHVIAPLGLLLDQKNGLLMYAPIYVFAFVGLMLLVRERRPEGFVIPLAGAFYLYVLIALSGERWHGEFSPAPRYLVVLVPLLAGPLAVAWDRCRGRAFAVTRGGRGL